MALPFAAPQQLHVEVADSAPADFALVDEFAHLVPRLLDRHAGLVRPVELVKVDALHAKTAQGVLALAADGSGAEVAQRLLRRVGDVPHKPAFREYQGPVGLRQLLQKTAHDLFRVAVPIHAGSVDPGDAGLDGPMHGGDGIGVVLRPPSPQPSAADRPRAQTDHADHRAIGSEPPYRQSHASSSRRSVTLYPAPDFEQRSGLPIECASDVRERLI